MLLPNGFWMLVQPFASEKHLLTSMDGMFSFWLVRPDRYPLGLIGVCAIVACLALSVLDYANSTGGMLIWSVLLLAGVGLCALSLAREKANLYAVIGVAGTVLYLIAAGMGSLVSPTAALMH